MSEFGRLRVAVYARFSTDRQSATSCADQIAKAARFVRERGGEIDPTLVFRDEAISGAVRDRPGLLALVAACEAGRVDVVIVEAMDRLSRDTEDSAWVRRRLPRLIAMDNGIDTASEGAAFTADIFAAVAAQIRRDIGKKTLRGMRGKAEAGLATGGALPYGYRSIKGPQGHGIVIDDDQAEVVREMFAAYASGRSLSAVATMLNDRGVAPPRSSRSRKRNAWGVSTVRSILHNAKYRGEWTFGCRKWKRDPDTRRRVPVMREEPLVSEQRPELAIIAPDIAAAVVARFEQSKATYGRKGRRVPDNKRHSYPLSGLLRCEHCGELMSVNGGARGRRYYRCSGAQRGVCALRRYIAETVVRERVIDKIREVFDSDAGHALIRETVAAAMDADDARAQRRRELVRHVERGEARSRRLALAVADGDAPDAILLTLREVEKRLRADRALLDQLDNTPARTRTAPEPSEVLDGITAALEGPPEVVRQQLRVLLDGERLDVFQEADGSVVVRGALDLGVVVGAQKKGSTASSKRSSHRALRGPDLNRRPSGYEPDELPDCSTPRQGAVLRQRRFRFSGGDCGGRI